MCLSKHLKMVLCLSSCPRVLQVPFGMPWHNTYSKRTESYFEEVVNKIFPGIVFPGVVKMSYLSFPWEELEVKDEAVS